MGLLDSIWQKISLSLLLFKAEKDYPIFDLLFQNYKSHNMNEIINFRETLDFRSFNPNIFEYSDKLIDEIEKLVKIERSYFQKKDDDKKILPKLALAFQIINDAKDAIQKLEQINSSNKKIAYYESSKNANLDDLVRHFSKKLDLKNEEELHLPFSRKEIKLKRFIARLKKHHTLTINYYFAFIKIYDIEFLKVHKDEKKFLKGIKGIMEFFTLGHATHAQIHKSIALQLYSIYKNDFTHTQLTNIIGNIIDIVFETDRNYQNFNGFNQKRVYIKNRVDNFILFDLDDDMNTIQKEKINKIFEDFIIKETIFFLRPFKRKLIHNIVSYPLEYLLSMEQVKSFGFAPKKI